MVKLYENNKIFSSKTHGAEILDTLCPKSCNLLSWSHYHTQSKTMVIGSQKAMVITTPEDDHGQDFEEKTEDEMSSEKTMVIDNSKTMVIDSPKTIGLIWPVKTGAIWPG